MHKVPLLCFMGKSLTEHFSPCRLYLRQVPLLVLAVHQEQVRLLTGGL